MIFIPSPLPTKLGLILIVYKSIYLFALTSTVISNRIKIIIDDYYPIHLRKSSKKKVWKFPKLGGGGTRQNPNFFVISHSPPILYVNLS